jgi:hypothetical protein
MKTLAILVLAALLAGCSATVSIPTPPPMEMQEVAP